MKKLTPVLCSLLLLTSAALWAQEAPSSEVKSTQSKPLVQSTDYPWFVGGAIGFAFGSSYDYAEFSPILGYQISSHFQLGGSLTFRYRKDKRFDPDLSTTDQGASILARVFIWGPIFIQGEAERLNWDYIARLEDGGYTVVESTYTGLYAGFGFVQATSPRSAMYMTFLWDFEYESGVPSPNPDPFMIRIGYGFKF